MDSIRVERQGSLVVATFPSDPSVEAITKFFDQMDAILAEGRPFGLLLDASLVTRTSPEVRELAPRRLKAKEADRRRLVRGEAVVLSSVVIRGVLAAMYLVAPPGYPTKTFSKASDARAWLDDKVRGAS